jgi:hypothetical protein
VKQDGGIEDVARRRLRLAKGWTLDELARRSLIGASTTTHPPARPLRPGHAVHRHLATLFVDEPDVPRRARGNLVGRWHYVQVMRARQLWVLAPSSASSAAAESDAITPDANVFRIGCPLNIPHGGD